MSALDRLGQVIEEYQLDNGKSVPDRLRKNPFTADDQVIEEYQFDNDAYYGQLKEISTWEQKKMTWGCWGCCALLAWPCILYKVNKDVKTAVENDMENVYCRRLAITHEGIAYKTLEKEMMGGISCCHDMCCVSKRYPELKEGATSKVIPYSEIQDVRVTEPAGAHVKRFCCCTCGSVPFVTNQVDVDTAGGFGLAPELKLWGVTEATKFQRIVLQKKYAIERHGNAPDIVSSEPMRTEDVPPNSMEMQRLSSSVQGADTQLLRDISAKMDVQTTLLERLCLAQEQTGRAPE